MTRIEPPPEPDIANARRIMEEAEDRLRAGRVHEIFIKTMIVLVILAFGGVMIAALVIGK